MKQQAVILTVSVLILIVFSCLNTFAQGQSISEKIFGLQSVYNFSDDSSGTVYGYLNTTSKTFERLQFFDGISIASGAVYFADSDSYNWIGLPNGNFTYPWFYTLNLTSGEMYSQLGYTSNDRSLVSLQATASAPVGLMVVNDSALVFGSFSTFSGDFTALSDPVTEFTYSAGTGFYYDDSETYFSILNSLNNNSNFLWQWDASGQQTSTELTFTNGVINPEITSLVVYNKGIYGILASEQTDEPIDLVEISPLGNTTSLGLLTNYTISIPESAAFDDENGYLYLFVAPDYFSDLALIVINLDDHSVVFQEAFDADETSEAVVGLALP